MKPRGFRNPTIVAAALLLVACTTPSYEGPSREAPSPRVAQFEKEYRLLIEDLLPGMSDPDIERRRQPQQELEAICHAAGAPGDEARRAGLARAMMAFSGPETATPARVWLLRKIEPLGADEVVDALAGLLRDEDPQIRELARRALQANPSPRAGDALREAVITASGPRAQVAFLNALGARRERKSLAVVIPFTEVPDPRVFRAAVGALGDIGGPKAAERLEAIRKEGDPRRAEDAALAEVRIAEQMLSDGDREGASRVFRDVYLTAPPGMSKIASLRGLVQSLGTESLPTLLARIQSDEDGPMAAVAASFTHDLPGQETTLRLVATLDEAATPAHAKGLLARALGDRGDRAALEAVTRAAGDPDPRVRLASLEALGKLGGAETVPFLVVTAARTEGTEQAAARAAVDGLRAEGTDSALLRLVAKALPAERIEAIRALEARRAEAAVPSLLEAAGDPANESAVRVAALRALGGLGRPGDAPALVDVLLAAPEADTLAAAEDAVVSVCLRTNPPSDRAAPVLFALEAGPPVRAPLVRVLGRLEGEAALAAVREALASGDEEVTDAAVRALAGWSTPEVLDDLERLARESASSTHRILALRGYIRLVRIPEERSDAERLTLLREALTLAERPDESRLAVAGVGEIPTPEALETALTLVDDANLQAEAAAAVCAIARTLGLQGDPAAYRALERTRESTRLDTVRARVEATLAFLEEHRGYCVVWRFSGPYRSEGVQGVDLLAVPFAPEEEDGASAEWTLLRPIDREEPWRFDLEKRWPDSNCVAYVRTHVVVPEDAKARLLVGSDDGVKVWVGGTVVLDNPVNRGLRCGEDEIVVDLCAGANELLVKIAQGSGAWGVCVAVRDEAGGPIPGLEFVVD